VDKKELGRKFSTHISIPKYKTRTRRKKKGKKWLIREHQFVGHCVVVI
jgi:hypothetical protein